MEGKKRKQSFIKNKRYKREIGIFWIVYTLLFMGACAAVFWIFWAQDRTFVWKVDGWSQHIKALQFYSDWLQGIAKNLIENHQWIVPLWSEHIGYGSDIITTLHYYVAGDPLCLLSVFVPDVYMAEFYNGLIFLRLYLAGLSFSALCIYFYAKRNGKSLLRFEEDKKEYVIRLSGLLAGCVLYLFSGYTMVMGLHHPYFLNPLIYFPLLLIGVEKVMEGRSPALWIGMVFISAVSNFYFFYMIGCNVIIYVLIRLWFSYGRKKIKKIFCQIGRIGLYTTAGIALSGIMLVPVLTLLMSTERMQKFLNEMLFYDKRYYEEFPASFFAPVFTRSYSATMTFSFIAFFCVLLLFMQRKKYRELKTAFILMTVFLCLPFMGKVFNGFSYASNRWIFGYVTLISCITVVMWQKLFDMSRKKLAATAAVLAAVSVWLLFHPSTAVKKNIYLIIVLFVAAWAVLFMGRMVGKKQRVPWSAIMMSVLIMVSAGVNAYYLYAPEGLNKAAEYKKTDEVKKYLKAPIDTAVKNVIGEKKEYYRYSAPSELIERNSTLKSGLMSTHFYWSMSDRRPSQFFREMGINNKTDYNYRELGGRTILNTLAGVKYYIVKKGRGAQAPYGYQKIGQPKVETERGITEYEVYENPSALPLGYTYDTYLDRKQYEKMTPTEKEKAIFQSILLEKDIAGYEKAKIKENGRRLSWEIKEREDVDWDGHTFSAQKAGGTVVLEIKDQMKNCETELWIKGLETTVKKEQVILKCFGTLSGGQKVKRDLLYLTPMHLRNIGRKNFIVNLGWGEKSKNEIKIKFSKKGKYTVKDIQILGQSLDGYEKQAEERRENVLENIQIGNNQITGKISAAKKKILCLTIPYSKGWTAWVDGEKKELLEGNTMFTALPLEKGNHTICLKYRTPGLLAGCAVSGIGVIGCVFVYAMERRKNKRGKV